MNRGTAWMGVAGDFKDDRLVAIINEPVTRYPVVESDLVHQPLCLICGGGDLEVLAQVFVQELEVFTTVACRQCLYVWRAVSPGGLWFATCAAMLSATGSEVVDDGLEVVRTQAYLRRVKFINSYVNVFTALDVGSANGSGVAVLAGAGYEVVAVEPDPARATLLSTICLTVTDTVEGAIFSWKQRYGLVMMCHLLEHCLDPFYVMENINRLMLSDGILYVEVPSWGIINWSDAFYLAHHSNFTSKVFAQLAAKARLEIIAARSFVHEGGRVDCGWILGVKSEVDLLPIRDVRTIQDLRKLYRVGLPFEVGEGILKYRVPYLDHFNFGMRFNRWGATCDGEFIEFKEV